MTWKNGLVSLTSPVWQITATVRPTRSPLRISRKADLVEVTLNASSSVTALRLITRE